MRKLLTIVTMVCFMLSMGAVAFADQGDVAAISPFSDVPKNHWAYSAIQQLQKDGVITGYDNSSFSGNQTITRYECAMMVSAAMAKLRSEMNAKGASLIAAVPQPGQTKEQAAAAQAKLDASIANISKQDRALIQKLAAEFAAELDAMGVKVDAIGADLGKIEAKIDRMPKMSWAAQIQVDPNHMPYWNGTQWSSLNSPDSVLWVSPMVNGYIDGNWRYFAELRFYAPLVNGNTSTVGGDPKGITQIDLRNAYAYGKGLGATWYIGRFEDNLPFTNAAGKGGLVTDSRLDGLRIAMDGGAIRGDLFAGLDVYGYSQAAQKYTGNTALLAGADAAWNYGPGNVYAGYYYGTVTSNAYTAYNNPVSYLTDSQNFIELGLDYQLTSKALATVYAATNATPTKLTGQNTVPDFAQGQNLSWMGRLDYGTYDAKKQGSMNVYAMYAHTGANSVWSSPNYDVSSLTYWGKNQEVCGINGNAQGFEVGLDWAPVTNMDWHLSWSNTTAIDAALAGEQAAASTMPGGYASMDSQRNIFKSEFTFMF